MANFTAGTSFTDGVTNDVTAAKLNALIADAVPTANLSLNSTTGTVSNFTTSTATINGPITASTAVINVGSGQIYKDASGNVGIGTTSPINKLTLASNKNISVGLYSHFGSLYSSEGALIGYNAKADTTSNVSGQVIVANTDSVGYGFIRCGVTGAGGSMAFHTTTGAVTAGAVITDSNERMRINSSGNLLVGATTGQNSERLLVQNSSAVNPSFIAYSPSATFAGYVTRIWADRNTSDSTYNFLSCTRVGSAGDVFIIRDSGNAVNTNNSYGAISDIKLKENIENASSQWDDIKSIQVRKFSFKNDEEHKRMLGLVAQEVELISPNLVETVIDRDKDGSDLGTTTKEVKYSVLYMKAVKALQEAMVRIEALESKVTALGAA